MLFNQDMPPDAAATKRQHWAFLKELVPLLLILAILDYFLFGGKLFTCEPSPLWLLILLIAPRHSSVAGIVCGLVAGTIYLWCMSKQGLSWQDMLHSQPAILIRPSLFLLCGTYLGTLNGNRARQTEHFRDKAANLAAQLDSSEIKRTELERSHIEIEKRIAGQSATLSTLHENFKRLGRTTSEKELLFALDIVLREESRAENCGIWRISRNRHILAAGRFNGNPPPIALAAGKNHKIINAADWSRHEETAPGADLSALIQDNESERLVVALAGVPFTRLTQDLVLRIGLLAEQAGLVLETLRSREILQNQAAPDTESGLVSETYLRRRINEEAALARRHKTPLSLLACSIAGKHENMQSRLKTVLSCSIRACIRFSDGLAWFPNAGAFVVVLPQCDEVGAEIVLKKIEANLEKLDLHDDNNHAIYTLTWNILACDSSLKGDAIFARLFSGMNKEALA